ncbi:MAG: hypothetical protein KGI83_03840, partial [Verrucomicrobiota bacterium]|nr:hypothetical protein [Verrucomicrobiota bacterium]
MSTSFQQMYEKWVEDNAAFLAQAQEVQNGVAQIYGNGSPSNPGDLAAFKAKLDKMDVSASYALMLLFYILGASSQNSTLLGYYTDKSGLTGERLKLNGLLTKVDNDLNNMAQSNSSHSSDMVLFCQATDTVLNELNGGDPNLNPNAAYPSMDPEAQLSVYNQLLQIRQLFYLGNDAPYDPTGDSYYFAPNGTGT